MPGVQDSHRVSKATEAVRAARSTTDSISVQLVWVTERAILDMPTPPNHDRRGPP